MNMQSYQVTLPLLDEAAAEAQRLGHWYVAPEHLLLAVAAKADGTSRVFFARHNLTPETIRESLSVLVGPPAETTESHDEPPALAQRSVIALAHAISLGRFRRTSMRGESNLPERRQPYSPGDLLLAVLADDVAPGAVVGAVIERAGLSVKAARAEVVGLNSGRQTS